MNKMRTRSKINSPNSKSNGKIHKDGGRSKRLETVQSNDKNAILNTRKRTQAKSNSNTLASVSHGKTQRSEQSVTNPESNTVNCKLRYKLRSQSETLSKEIKSNKRPASNEENLKTNSINFLEISSDAKKSRFKENVDKNVLIQESRPVRIKKAIIPTNSTENHQSKRPNLQVVRKIELRQLEKIDVGNIILVKWPSYPYWPARILQIWNESVEVIFFGDNNRTAKVKKDRIFDFHSNYDYIIKTLKTVQWRCVFRKAICETEIYSQVPLEASIINVIENKN